MSFMTSRLEDYAAIEKAVQFYLEGARTGSGETMAKAFRQDAMMYGSDLSVEPISGLFAWNEENGPAADIQARIVTIDMVGSIAYAKLEIDNWTGEPYTDMLLLLKNGDRWEITTKLFQFHE